MSAQQRAVDHLAYYFKTAFEGAGLSWGGDNQIEIEETVGHIADMVREQVRQELRQAIRTEVRMYLASPKGEPGA